MTTYEIWTEDGCGLAQTFTNRNEAIKAANEFAKDIRRGYNVYVYIIDTDTIVYTTRS